MCPQVDTSKEAILALPDRLRRMHPATLWKMQQRGMEIFRQHLSTLPAMLDTTFATLMARYRQSPEAAAATVAVAASSPHWDGTVPSVGTTHFRCVTGGAYHCEHTGGGSAATTAGGLSLDDLAPWVDTDEPTTLLLESRGMTRPKRAAIIAAARQAATLVVGADGDTSGAAAVAPIMSAGDVAVVEALLKLWHRWLDRMQPRVWEGTQPASAVHTWLAVACLEVAELYSLLDR